MFITIYLQFVYPTGKPIIHHFVCYQELAVANYGFALDAAELTHPRLLLSGGVNITFRASQEKCL